MGRKWYDAGKPYTLEELAEEHANKQRWIAEKTGREIANLKLGPVQWKEKAAVEIIALSLQTSEAETMSVENIVAIIDEHYQEFWHLLMSTKLTKP